MFDSAGKVVYIPEVKQPEKPSEQPEKPVETKPDEPTDTTPAEPIFSISTYKPYTYLLDLNRYIFCK